MADERLLPPGIRDENWLAMLELLDRLDDLDLGALLVYRLSSVDASALSHLAWQFHLMGTEGFELAASEAQRRTLVQNAIERHRHKGTPWALKDVITLLDLTATIVEWWQEAAAPFTFRLQVEIGDSGLTLAGWLYLLGLIESYKRKAAHMTELTSLGTQQGALVYAPALVTGSLVEIAPGP